MTNKSTARFRPLFFLHLVQDIDLIEPLLEKSISRQGIQPSVWVTDRLYGENARVPKIFKEMGLEPKVLSYYAAFFGFFPSLSGFDALITAAESSAGPHRVAHLLTQKANRRGLKTYTLQQGFENVGLTISQRADFASQAILLWGPLGTLDPGVSEAVRKRCVPAGCPKKITAAGVEKLKKKTGERLVSIFENLHRSAYSEAAIKKFIECFKDAAARYPDVRFVLKPHPNQRWTAIHCGGEFSELKNITVADPKDSEWSGLTAAALISVSDAVITTPSTVALDAARAGCPAAIFDMGNEIERYRPLALLKNSDEWKEFICRILDGPQREEERIKARAFAEKNTLAGDAASRILDFVMIQ